MAAKRGRRQQSAQQDKGRRSYSISKVEAKSPLRRSTRLNAELIEHALSIDGIPERELIASRPEDRKRSREVDDDPPDWNAASPILKRPRINPTAQEQTDSKAPSHRSKQPTNPVDYWRREHHWPKEYFEPEDMADFLLAKRRSTPSFRRKRSGSDSATASSVTPSDQKPREEKSAPYQDPRYKTLLETKGVYMSRSHLGIVDASKELCSTMLEGEQHVPNNTLFRDDVFDKACENLQAKNEARVIQDIARLIVPSAETLAAFGARHLDILVESVNEGWNNAIPLFGSRPQPDYSVGFKRTAFTQEQLTKINPIIGNILTDISYFMGTYYMYFPFFTCEVKCGAGALDIADRQNAHSMTLAVRALVELFRLVKREKEVHRQILAFSVSHDHRSVRIYGHYPVIDGKDTTTYYHHPIQSFDFTHLDGKDKWTAYKFTKNIYDTWMPQHLDRIRSVLDELPSQINFDVPNLSEGTGLSQNLEGHHLPGVSTEPESLQVHDRGSADARQDITPDTSFSKPEQSSGRRKPARRGRPAPS